jgi:hypothetical protein
MEKGWHRKITTKQQMIEPLKRESQPLWWAMMVWRQRGETRPREKRESGRE